MNNDEKAVPEEALDAYLDGREEAAPGYPNSTATPSAGLDAKILAAASEAVSKPTGTARSWNSGFAIAATMVLAAGLVIVIRNSPSLEPPPVVSEMTTDAAADAEMNVPTEAFPGPLLPPTIESAATTAASVHRETQARGETSNQLREKKANAKRLLAQEVVADVPKPALFAGLSLDESADILSEEEQTVRVSMPAVRRAVIDESQQRLVMIREAVEAKDLEKAQALLLMFRNDYPDYPLTELEKQLPAELFEDVP